MKVRIIIKSLVKYTYVPKHFKVYARIQFLPKITSIRLGTDWEQFMTYVLKAIMHCAQPAPRMDVIFGKN